MYLFSLYQYQGGSKVHNGDPSVDKKKKTLYLIQRNSKNRRLYETKVTYQNKPKRDNKAQVNSIKTTVRTGEKTKTGSSYLSIYLSIMFVCCFSSHDGSFYPVHHTQASGRSLPSTLPHPPSLPLPLPPSIPSTTTPFLSKLIVSTPAECCGRTHCHTTSGRGKKGRESMIGYICISVFKKSPTQQLKPWLQQGLPNFCMSRASGYKTADPVLRNLNLWGILVSGQRDMSLCS